MTIKTLAAKGVPKRAIARQLDVCEGTVRYHLRRMAQGAQDGRRRQQRLAARCCTAIDHWVDTHEGAINTAALHDWLVSEHGYTGSLRSVQRFVSDRYPPPPRRARRRVETPPGVQAQADWASFPRLVIGGRQVQLHAFHLLLSHSRAEAIIWLPRQDQMCWLAAHNEAFRRLGGIPAVVRVDNTKTAVIRGAGSWGVLNESYRRYAATVRFHIDPCLPYSPQHKGKVERAIRSQRWSIDPARRAWDDVAELQAWTDQELLKASRRRRCPATGGSVWEAWQSERAALAPVPALPEPFDAVATRRVGSDGLVSFEGRQYSVPFVHIGQRVEIRGGRRVQVLAANRIIAEHPRGTEHRIVLDPDHYEGPGTPTVKAPMPLGRLGRRIQEIANTPVAQRPIDLYAALTEAVR